jgi:hypothetical protein
MKIYIGNDNGSWKELEGVINAEFKLGKLRLPEPESNTPAFDMTNLGKTSVTLPLEITPEGEEWLHVHVMPADDEVVTPLLESVFGL